MLRLQLQMEFAPESIDEVTGVLRSLAGPVRAEPGCSSTRLVQDADSSGGLAWVEEWRSEEAFEMHLRGASFRRILAVMDLAARAPKVEIDEVSSRRGFEFVEEVLGLCRAEIKVGAFSTETPVD